MVNVMEFWRVDGVVLGAVYLIFYFFALFMKTRDNKAIKKNSYKI